MFGFQRTGDEIWAAADQLTRGFLIGATAGKTTLTGEGLQHADGHSPLLASTNPAIRHYDPAYAYEIAHIMEYGLETMFGEQPQDVIFYLTVYNEPIIQPAQPENVDIEGIRKGMYLLREAPQSGHERPRIQLLASGTAVSWVLEAAELLNRDYGVGADVWSVTSWNELRRDAMESDAPALAGGAASEPYLVTKLKGRQGPVLAVSDFMRAVQDQIAPWVEQPFFALGADGFGFSDTRAAARRWLRIDAASIVMKSLQLLAQEGTMPPDAAMDAFVRYRMDDVNATTSLVDLDTPEED